MPARSRPAAAPGARALGVSLDLVCLTLHAGALAVLLTRPRGGWGLPGAAPGADGAIAAPATALARATLGRDIAWLEPLGAFGDGRRHPSGAPLSVSWVGLAPRGTTAPVGTAWVAVGALPTLAPRVRAMIDAAVQHVRARLDQVPLAFKLLPATFTLSELQEVYELLLGRRLHKASFRRSLHGAWLVEPTDAWRSEGRGRPAQLFRFAPRRRRGAPRPVRFAPPT
jgi:8-oxo-dGTP diphosphatase